MVLGGGDVLNGTTVQSPIRVFIGGDITTQSRGFTISGFLKLLSKSTFTTVPRFGGYLMAKALASFWVC